MGKVTDAMMSGEGRLWRPSLQGWICRSGRGCEPLREYEGACIGPDCEGTSADVLYRHDADPDYRCPCGHRLCVDHPPEIVAYACHSCGLVQAPEPAQTTDGQLLLL